MSLDQICDISTTWWDHSLQTAGSPRAAMQRVSLEGLDFVEEQMPTIRPTKPDLDDSQAPDNQPVSATQARELVLRGVAGELKAARMRAGITVAELHRRTGISRTVLQGYEAGRFGPGTIELKKVCEVLAVTPNQIVFGKEDPLEEKSLLESLIGDLNVATNAVRLSAIFQLLSTQERSAIFALIESIATPRIGGTEQLKIAMEAFDIMFKNPTVDPNKLEEFAKTFVEELPEDTAEKLRVLEEKSNALQQKKPPPRKS